MDSSEPTSGSAQQTGRPDPGSKKRRLRGACDVCKHKKIRCDSAKMPGGVCSHCITYNCQCTHQGNFKVLRPLSAVAHIADSFLQSSKVQPDDRSAQDHVDTILIHSTAYIAPGDLRDVLLKVARYCRSLEQELAGFRQLEAALSPGVRRRCGRRR
ncbi:hypothetical protein C8J57DRAFT_606725 [Mycena rebaudengoi]|nr:hypothetical protein C8J57DRAFT_606725 [Mycena rebaudengoi]